MTDLHFAAKGDSAALVRPGVKVVILNVLSMIIRVEVNNGFHKTFISSAGCTRTTTLSGSDASAGIRKSSVASFDLDVWVEETVSTRSTRAVLSSKESLFSLEDGNSTFLLTVDKYMPCSLASRLGRRCSSESSSHKAGNVLRIT